MVDIPVVSLLGLGRIPRDRTSAKKWFERNGIPISVANFDGRKPEFVSLLDLPDSERLAYCLRRAEEAGLSMGAHDDAAHIALQARPRGTQAMAEERAALLMFVHRHQAAGLTWPQIAALFKGAGFGEGPSYKTVKRWFERVAGVDPANWAPALAPDYVGNTERADMHPDAWEEFCARIAAHGGNGTGPNFMRQWKEIGEAAAKAGWAWPSYETVLREWKRQPVEWQRAHEMGTEEAVKSITMRLHRGLDGLKAMEQVELDGREFKVKVRFPDGKIGCPWVIVYADRASSKIVGWAISDSENEDAAAEATIQMCERYGIPDRVVTDNGAAFNGKRMAGGLSPLIRRNATKAADWDVPGLFKIYGIALKNCTPRKSWAKVVESLYSVLRHIDNDPVFFGAQRSGPNDRPNPDAEPVCFDLFAAFIDREINRFNADRTTRAMGVRKGENRNEAFERLSDGRVYRPVTPFLRREARVKYKRVLVKPDGRIAFDGGLWGDESTQSQMLHHVGTYVLAGFDPSNYSAPAIVRGWSDPALKGRMLFEALPNFEAARHNDEASRRRAIREERRAKDTIAKHKPNDTPDWVAKWRAEIMANAGQFEPPTVPTVIQIDTRGPFSPRGPLYQPTDPEEANRRLDELEAEILRQQQEAEGKRAISGGNR